MGHWVNHEGKYRQLKNTKSEAANEKGEWLTAGRTYHVLSIVMEEGRGLEFQLIGNDGTTPAFFDADRFEIISDVIPSNWHVTEHNRLFALEPRSWSRPGFWEDYFDGVGEAVLLFELEKKRIIEEDPNVT